MPNVLISQLMLEKNLAYGSAHIIIAARRQKESMAIIVSNWYETVDFIEEDDIDMTGLTV